MTSFFKIISLTSLLILSSATFAQDPGFGDFQGLDDDDLTIGGDIFNDFNEDLEETQISEDERFYKYGRFFSFQVGFGTTSFDQNRGAAYANDFPSYGLSINYFSDFQSSWGLGFEYSKHSMYFNDVTKGFQTREAAGFIEVSMLRVFFSYRYYIDTSNLGTAITYSNPYFTGRLEYWYTSNKYRDLSDYPDDKGGGIGLGLGFGLDFPIKLKESYLNLEFLFHDVAFHDKYTRIYAPVDDGAGFDDLDGYGYTTMMSYVWSW